MASSRTNAAREWLFAVAALMNPIAPWRWRRLARAIASLDGWKPPMLIIAAIGSGFGLHFMFGAAAPAWQIALESLNWATWTVVGLIATMIVTHQGITHIMRMGLWGATRHRWWFEVARLAFIVALLNVLLLLLSGTVPPLALGGIPRAVGAIAFQCAAPLVGVFLVTATMGYVIAALRWRPCLGKAFECVHYFYMMLVGIGLLTAGGLWWQPQQAWLEQAAAIALVGAGILTLVAGIVSIAKREERKQKRRAAMPDHVGNSGR